MYKPTHVCRLSIPYGELLQQSRTIKEVFEDVAAKGELSGAVLDQATLQPIWYLSLALGRSTGVKTGNILVF